MHYNLVVLVSYVHAIYSLMELKNIFILLLFALYSVPLRHTKGTDVFLIKHFPKNVQISMDKYWHTDWRTKCHTIDCTNNRFLLLQKHL